MGSVVGAEPRYIICAHGAQGGTNMVATFPDNKHNSEGIVTAYDYNNSMHTAKIVYLGGFRQIRMNSHPQNYMAVVEGTVRLLDLGDDNTSSPVNYEIKNISGETISTLKETETKVLFYHPGTNTYLSRQGESLAAETFTGAIAEMPGHLFWDLHVSGYAPTKAEVVNMSLAVLTLGGSVALGALFGIHPHVPSH